MEKVVVLKAKRTIAVEDFEQSAPGEGEVLVRTLFSGISAGTLLTLYRGNSPFARKQFDSRYRLFEDSAEEPELYPIPGCDSYEEVGVVEQVGLGVQGVKPGDVVCSDWGHRTSAVIEAVDLEEHKLPEGLDPLCGVFAQIGSIAMNAVLDADIHVGETVVVFGQGVPGQIVSQLVRLNGATVFVADTNEKRLEKSLSLGAHRAFNPAKTNIARDVRDLTGGRGADVCIEISGSTQALQQAIRTVCYNGRVVCSGFYPGESSGLYLGEEFHHNRVQLVCSQIRRINPALSHRWDKLRLERTVMDLQAQGKLGLKPLVTHVIDYNDAARAYDILDKGLEDCLQVVMDFRR